MTREKQKFLYDLIGCEVFLGFQDYHSDVLRPLMNSPNRGIITQPPSSDCAWTNSQNWPTQPPFKSLNGAERNTFIEIDHLLHAPLRFGSTGASVRLPSTEHCHVKSEMHEQVSR